MKIRYALACLAAALVFTPTAAHAATPFYADSGDRCRYGVTEGVFESQPTAVTLKGTLLDRPLPADPTNCFSDGLYSIGVYSAYLGTRLVDQQSLRVDNGIIRVLLTLGSASAVSRIDRLVVQVCRVAVNSPTPAPVCGKPSEYRLPQ